MVAAQNATQRSLIGSQEPASATEQTFSKDQIAHALGSKDPSWFRQTADRGANSAAYRKNQVEDEDRLDMSSIKAQLPGMSKEAPQQQQAPPPSIEPVISTPTRNRLASPPTLNPPRLDASGDEKTPGDRSAHASPALSGRTSPLRSTSPTKGMGGFVQSAMMKRSDSVKRWSVASPPSMARADSVASSRSGALSSRPQSMARPGSTTPSSSRPTSRHGEPDADNDATPKAPTIDTTLERTPRTEETHLPISPSKTMDPRRWSPTKSSWLESALNKPESPKPTHKSNTSQPAWMAELNKTKADKAGTSGPEFGRPRPGSISHRHQVSIGGLMRSSPMGSDAKPNATGLGGIYSPPPGGNRPAYGIGTGLGISKSAPKLEPAESEDKDDEPVPEPEKEPETKPEPVVPEKEPQEPEKKPTPVATPKSTPPLGFVKPKPETPPKKDFRGSLRHRPSSTDTGKSQEPEFKNVFGNLRRTKTQNYVAPDELKDNILRGKAALSLTGGPQKSERVDEFKEAILKKKHDFKQAQAEGKGITRTSTMPIEKPLPEGLARRAELGRSLSSKKDSTTEVKPLAPAKKPDSPKPTPGPKRVPSQPLSSPKATPPRASPKPADLGAPKPDPYANRPKTKVEPKPIPVVERGLEAPFKSLGRVGPVQGRGGSALADRFNPALAGMLARGPPPMSTNGGQDSEDAEPKSTSRTNTSTSEPATEPTSTGPQLTHMTKGRARGPRRKAPTATAAPAPAAAPVETPAPERRPLPEPTRVEPRALTPVKSREIEPKQEEVSTPVEKEEETTPARLSIQQQSAARAAIRSKPSPARPITKAPETFKAEPSTPSYLRKHSTSPIRDGSDIPPPLKIQKTGSADFEASSPRKLDLKRVSKFFDEKASENPKPEPKEPVKLTHQRTGSRSPVKMFSRQLPSQEPSSPTKVDRDPVVSVKNATYMFGGASPKSPPVPAKPSFEEDLPEVETPKPLRASSRPLPIPSPFETPKTARSPRPLPSPKPNFETPQASTASSRPLPVPPKDEPPKSPSAVASPSNKSGNDASSMLHDFFGPQQPRKPCNFDAGELLMNRPKLGGKIQTSTFEKFQIFGDGKKLPIDPEHERVLYEEEMYLCPHNFVNEAGWKRSEVYFWIGDEVPESAADDAHVFIQREVRAMGGSMIKIRQGKETPEFLQALGGVAIIKRGSSSKHDSVQPIMLCGRRFHGQVAFDQVDRTAASLCAGFPYLITQAGKCYLWKGKGADVDELSCARLVGMDMTPTGELIEVDDGNEPDSFWDIFQGGSKPHSADHWRLKPTYPKYCGRLFCSNADTRRQVSFSSQLARLASSLFANDSPAQISEVHPFNQADLSPAHIYILDAFFEMYIIVGADAQAQYSSFRNALDFAQEYAILASSMEDRPFIPISTVVLEGIPRDLKRVFRKWRDGLAPTALTGGAGLTRGRSLRVVPLTQALLAMNE